MYYLTFKLSKNSSNTPRIVNFMFILKYCRFNRFTVFIHINALGAMHFLKGMATITDKKNQLSSPVAMGI